MEKVITKTWRFIPYEERTAYENMAIDEVLMTSYRLYHKPIFRLYGWYPAGFSIGYSQNPFQFLDVQECLSQNISIVRRLTGGGCIPHTQGITYSLVFSDTDINLADSVKASFQYLCYFLINFYRQLGLEADFAINTKGNEPLGDFTDLCFASSQHYDITIGSKKIGGNAQKRNKDLIFQHGFIPVNRNKKMDSFFRKKTEEPIYTLEDFGITENVASLAQKLKKAFTATHGVDLNPSALDNEEKALYAHLVADKYRTQQWNLHRIDPLKPKS